MKKTLVFIWGKSLLILGIFYLCSNPYIIKAQVGEQVDLGEEGFNPLTDDITKKIPTLEVLIESAISNSHSLKYLQNQVKLSTYQLKTVKRDWAKYISFAGSITEGSSSALTFVEDQFGNSVGTLGTTDQTRWSVGLSLRLPLLNVINYKNQTNIAKIDIESKIEQKLEAEKEIRGTVITLYNELVIQQKYLKIEIDNIEYASLASEMAENEYKENKISLGEMSRIRDVLSRSRGRYMATKINFVNAYVMLQEITGVKFAELNNWE